jgi:transcriptional regulator with XRE-family HTH domain
MPIKLLPRRLIGQTIRGIRNRLGMSQADFARSLGTGDAAAVARWERGQGQPDYGTLAKIATMGVVDVLVFHDTAPVDARPQLTPGEASELGEILARMEALMADARRLVDRASTRTAVELLDAVGTAPPALTDGAGALVLDAEVRVEAGPRARRESRSRTASAGRRAGTRATSQPRARGRTAGESGDSSTGTSSSNRSSSNGASSKNGSPSTGASSLSGASSKNGRSSTGTRAGGSRSRTTRTARRTNGSSRGAEATEGAGASA